MPKLWTMIEVFKYIEEQIKTLYPDLKDNRSKWSWHVEKVLSNHIIIYFDAEFIELQDRYPIIWSRDGSSWKLDTWDKTLKLILDERLEPTDEIVLRLKSVWGKY